MEHKQTEPIVTRLDETQGIVESIWAVMGNIDEGQDIIHPGSFAFTFANRGHKVKLLDNHRTDSVLASLGLVLELRELNREELPQELLTQYPEATGGAWGKFQFLLETPEGKGAFTRIQAGAIKGWSFGYDALQKERSTIIRNGESISVRNLREIRLYEVSPVLFPMNEATLTTGVKSTPDDDEAKAGRVLSARNASRILAALQELNSCLHDAGLMEMPEEENSAGPPKSNDPPTLDAQEAGPSNDNSTQQLIELELERLKLLEV